MTWTGRLALFGLTVVVAGICMALGLWQGRRLTERRAVTREALTARALPVVDLNRSGADADLSQRLALARGRFDHDRAFVLRGRVERSAPGVQVVTPLLLAGRDTAILVNRGFVPAVDAMVPQADAVNRADTAEVRGVLLPVPESPDTGGRLERGGAVSWRRLDRGAVRALLPYPVLDFYLHETEPEIRPPGGSPFPTPAAMPPLDDGPHLSYMIQWFGIGAAALGFGIAFVLRRGRR
jgi:surfeit locus 1 family protein